MTGSGDSVSIVIVTHNRALELLRTVESALHLPERPPVIVVDNASTDDSVARLHRDFPSVCVRCLPSNIGAAARNIGAREARTPYVAFCDDDVRWMPGTLPDDVQASLLRLMRRMQLVFGAIDQIRTPAGEHVFLEVNAGGEWGMLERDLGLPVSEALADALLERGAP